MIENDYALSDCSIEPICKEIIPANKLYLSNNAPGCKTLEELPDNCHFPIEITVLWIQQQLPPGQCRYPAPNLRRLSNFEQTALGQTDTAGIARLSTSRWDFYTLDLPDYPNGNWAVCGFAVLTDPPGLLDTLRQTFLLQAFTECPELELSLGLPSFFRGCLVNSEIKISVQNRGTALAEGVKLAFVKPSGLEMLSAIPSLTGQSGDTIYFELATCCPLAQQK